MEAHAHAHGHEPMPTEGRGLTVVALSATLHCLTGCAIGEITGMVVGTALGFSDWGTIALAVALAFLFGYTLTSIPLLRAGLALGAVIPIALASDTISIAIMEVVDNGIMLAIPGAMEAGLANVLFWGSLSVALVIAGALALPANRWLIARGKGHVAVHETGIHGGPDPRVIGVIAAVAAVFGSAVLLAEAFGGDDAGHGEMGGLQAGATDHSQEEGTMGEHEQNAAAPDAIRGLSATDGGLTLELASADIDPVRPQQLGFRIVDEDGESVREFELQHERRMHLIVARRDLTGFQHLHPRMDEAGRWTTPIEVPEGGEYRVFADFNHAGEDLTLATDLRVAGEASEEPLPPEAASASTDDLYEVRLEGTRSVAGTEAEIGFTVLRDGAPVEVQPYLGADGHLVALREGDLAFLHVHPVDGGHGGRPGGGPDTIAFMTEFPSEGRYRLFLQFRHDGDVHTAAFTREVSR
ncbi:MAG: DUF4396 domain-containing protein [Solirubrobacterales bacterium]